MEDAIFLVIKDIPLIGGGAITKGTHIHLINGIWYHEMGPFDTDLQDSFNNLVYNRKDWGNWLKVEQRRSV